MKHAFDFLIFGMMKRADSFLAQKLEVMQMLMSLQDPELLERVREALLEEEPKPQPLREQSKLDTSSDK